MSKEKLTVLEALKWTWIIWRDIAASYYDDEGQLHKEFHRILNKLGAVRKYGLNLQFECPCCEYMKHPVKTVSCSTKNPCPMSSVWGNKYTIGCETNGSPYDDWHSADFKISADAAQKIADGAWALYLDECERLNVPSGNKHLMPLDDYPIKKLDTYA